MHGICTEHNAVHNSCTKDGTLSTEFSSSKSVTEATRYLDTVEVTDSSSVGPTTKQST